MIDPDRYEIDKVMARRDSRQVVSECIRRLKWRPNEAILDYGCGPGTIAHELLLPIALKTHSRIYGIDNSPEMIEYALLRYAGMDRAYQQITDFPDTPEYEKQARQFLSFQLGDILGSFPFDPKFEFDKIFCIFVFHVIKDYQKAIHGLFRRLAPGGQLVFTLPSRTIYFRMYTMLLSNPKWKLIFEELPKYIPDWMESEANVEKVFRTSFEKAGFKILDCRTVRREYIFENLDAAAEFGLSINPLIKKVQVAALSQLREEYRQILLNNSDRYNVKYLQDGGPAKIDYDILAIICEKPDHGGGRQREPPTNLVFTPDFFDRAPSPTKSVGFARSPSPAKNIVDIQQPSTSRSLREELARAPSPTKGILRAASPTKITVREEIRRTPSPGSPTKITVREEIRRTPSPGSPTKITIREEIRRAPSPAKDIVREIIERPPSKDFVREYMERAASPSKDFVREYEYTERSRSPLSRDFAKEYVDRLPSTSKDFAKEYVEAMPSTSKDFAKEYLERERRRSPSPLRSVIRSKVIIETSSPPSGSVVRGAPGSTRDFVKEYLERMAATSKIPPPKEYLENYNRSKGND